MRIHVLSDLHLEFSPFAPQVTAADVIILAGDIHVKGRGVPWARQAFEGPVLYVPGNHEFYNSHLSHTLASMRAEADTRVRVLERDDVVINGTRFLGCTLWTDFTAKGSAHLAALQAHAEMNDFRRFAPGPINASFRMTWCKSASILFSGCA